MAAPPDADASPTTNAVAAIAAVISTANAVAIARVCRSDRHTYVATFNSDSASAPTAASVGVSRQAERERERSGDANKNLLHNKNLLPISGIAPDIRAHSHRRMQPII